MMLQWWPRWSWQWWLRRWWRWSWWSGAGAGALSASSLVPRLTDTASTILELYHVHLAVLYTASPVLELCAMYNCAPSCTVHLTASPILESLTGFCNVEYIANYWPAKYFLHSPCVLLSISCLVNYVRLCTFALCTSWALSRNLTHQLLHLPPSDPLDQDTVTIASASCNCMQLLCFCSVFLCTVLLGSCH